MDTSELEVTAALAQLELGADDVKVFGTAVGQMLEYFTKMREIDVTGLEPTTHALLKENRLRSDEIVESGLADALVANAPEREERLIVIPNVL